MFVIRCLILPLRTTKNEEPFTSVKFYAAKNLWLARIKKHLNVVVQKGLAMKRGLYFFVLLSFFVYGQGFNFSGSFATPSESGGSVVLTVQQDARGNITGTLQGDSATYQLQGTTDPAGFIVGAVIDPQGGGFAFEGYPGSTPDELLLSIYTDNSGQSQGQLVFQRQGAATATQPTPTTQPVAGNNPLAPSNQNANPLGATDPWLGTFSDGNLTLRLQSANSGYTGTLELSGQRYGLFARSDGANLVGQFESSGSMFDFSCSLQGDTVALTSGRNSYTLERQGASNPLGSSTPSTDVANDPVIAKGVNGNLTQDNALAFIEALEFSLNQSGYTQTFGEAEQQQLLQALTQNYPNLSVEEQAALARMREIWRGVQANWNNLSQDDRGGVILEIYALAFGREAVEAYLQQAQGGGQSSGGGGCQTIDDCIAMHASPEQMSAMNGQSSCWSSSGCTYYDSSTNTQYYEDR